jgi:2-C-methyl-D-erythritol 4-phosphate cytidylyltransferase
VTRLFAIVPAAGVGRRMGGEVPKQYLALGGQSVLEHTLARIAGQPGIVRVIVPVAAHDVRFATLTLPPTCVAVTGGAERCHSVLAGLDALAGEAADDDWVLVHDAARPCVRGADIARMVAELESNAVGGILAVPVRDTLKRCAADGRIEATVSRDGLWQAQTPQMFRFRLLREAIEAALAGGELVTDEAQAVERAGHVPRVVAGHGDNLKITQPEDLDLAARILAAQAAAAD